MILPGAHKARGYVHFEIRKEYEDDRKVTGQCAIAEPIGTGFACFCGLFSWTTGDDGRHRPTMSAAAMIKTAKFYRIEAALIEQLKRIRCCAD